MPQYKIPYWAENRSRQQLEEILFDGIGQFPFQWNFSVGQILNLACGFDGAALRSRGAINMDLHANDINLGTLHPVQVLGDIRYLPFKDGIADTVVLGEVLEHFNAEDVPAVLIEAARCLKPGGRIVATIPEDHRDSDVTNFFAPGVSVRHHLVMPWMICDWCEKAELDLQVLSRLDYGYFTGHGLVATRTKDKMQPVKVRPQQ